MSKRECFFSVLAVLFVTFSVYAAKTDSGGSEVHTPDYYESAARACVKRGDYATMKRHVDEGLSYYPDVSGLNELAGSYYYHYRDYDKARFYLFKAVADNHENVRAKQLLVDVEEATGNYSSAICYVNELLEVNPYWRGLWRRKIALYRKQGNSVMADHLLRRINQIYPNDSVLHRDLANRIEEEYIRTRKAGDRQASISYLEELVNGRPPYKEQYFLDLSNLYLQQGNTEDALRVAGQGASRLPGSVALVRKKAGILAEESRYVEAIAFVEERMRYNRSGELRTLRSRLEEEQARAESRRDPYLLYSRIYDSRKSDEALNYLLNTSFSRGYNEDALHYIHEVRKRKGNSVNLLYKEYIVQKRIGNTAEARRILEKLYARQPSNEEFTMAIARQRLEDADRMIATGNYTDAIESLRFVMSKSTDNETLQAAYSRMFTCQNNLKHYDEALQVLELSHARFPEDDSYVLKKAMVLNARGNAVGALALLADTLRLTPLDSELRPLYVSDYEEIAVPYIKSLIEAGAVPEARRAINTLLAFNPSSEDGLRYAITVAELLHQRDDYDRYTSVAHSYYPDDVAFLVKRSTIYTKSGRYRSAVDILRPVLDSLPTNQMLVGAYSENSERLAMQLMKSRRVDSAMAVIDSALVFDSRNHSLLYAKGLIFEAQHRYDSAYVYQQYYQPSFLESVDFKRHLNDLMSYGYKNAIGFEYVQGRYAEADVLTSVATASYERREQNNTYAGRLNYAGRDGNDTGLSEMSQTPGGVGIQLQAEWKHRFSDHWSGMLSAAWANRYFPRVAATVGITRFLKNDWTVDLSATYRRIVTYDKTFEWKTVIVDGIDEDEGTWAFNGWNSSCHNLFSAGLGVGKDLGDFYVDGKLEGFWLASKLYTNLRMRGKYFPFDDRHTTIQVIGSVGTAPEASLIDHAMPGTFDHLNSTVGLGGTYMLTRHVSLGVLGTWQTFYYQSRQRMGTQSDYVDSSIFSYRNLYNIYGQIYINF